MAKSSYMSVFENDVITISGQLSEELQWQEEDVIEIETIECETEEGEPYTGILLTNITQNGG